MTPGSNRETKYDSKYVAATVSLKVASQLSTMKAGFANPQGMTDMVAKEILVQTALNAATPSVPTIFWPFYFSFARQLWAAIHRGQSGGTLADTGHALKTKYLAYGLTGATLDAVAAVFSVTGI